MVDKLSQEVDPNSTAAREIMQEVAERVLRNLKPEDQPQPIIPLKTETSSM